MSSVEKPEAGPAPTPTPPPAIARAPVPASSGVSDPRRPPTDRVRVRRIPERGIYDRATIDGILDEGLVAHVGVVDADCPFVIPMAYVRDGDSILLHGARRARVVERMAEGAPLCVTVTLLDGLVLARSAFHHSMNYRSVVVLGSATPILDEADRQEAFFRFTDRVAPGRAALVRAPNAQESRATTILRLPLDEASAKIRVGGPIDDAEDFALPVWAGVVPLTLVTGEPIPDPTAHPAGVARPTSPLAGSPTRWKPEARC